MILGVVSFRLPHRDRLNNSGDIVTLYDVRGRAIDFVEYDAMAGNNQSISRYPDIVGVFEKHAEIADSNGALFSPGTHSNGGIF